MKTLPLNQHALLYDGCRLATLETVTLIGKSKTETPKEGDSSELIANTEFVRTVENKLNNTIKSEVSRLEGLINSLQSKLNSLDSEVKKIDSSLDSLSKYLETLESRVENIENQLSE